MMTNEQLVARIKAGEDVGENMAALYKQIKAFIHSIAWKYRDSGEVEDLEQEGYLALYSAIDGYDSDHGVKFLTYAEYHIRQRMRRYLQNNGSVLRLPVNQDDRVKQYKRFCNEFQMKHGRKPTDWESAACLGFTQEQIRGLQESACMGILVSLDSPVMGLDGGEDTTVGDMVASGQNMEEDTIDCLDHEQLCTVLWECVDSLEGRQPEVIRKRYQDGCTLAAIGEECGVTVETVRREHGKALRELRRSRNSERLRPYLEEAMIYGMALHGNGVGRFNHTWTSSTERVALRMAE